MRNPVGRQDAEAYEHYFRDPKVGDGTLGPPHSGIACRNIREALRVLDYSVRSSPVYDDELVRAVKAFQTDRQHSNRDGRVGPGTRRILTAAVWERSPGLFERALVSPEYPVFLSYSSKDQPRIEGILKTLEGSGVPLFRDKAGIPPGSSWPEAIFRAVRRCNVVLFVVSVDSVQSVNVLIELTLARHASKPIIPLRIDSVDVPALAHDLVSGFQWLDISTADGDQNLGRLLEALAIHGVHPYGRDA